MAVYSNFFKFCRNYSRLSLSEEAIKQSSKGWALDPANKVAPEVPILESIFHDRNLFTKDDDFLNTSYFVTPQSAFAAGPTQIRGSSAWSISSVFSKRLVGKCPSVQHFGQNATVFFWPAWHPVAQYRKSRPAMVIIRANALDFNGTEIPKEIKKRLQMKSVSPLDSARWRQANGRRFKKALWQALSSQEATDLGNDSAHQRLGSPETDGLYMAFVKRVPSIQETKDIMLRVVQQIAKSGSKFDNTYPVPFNISSLNQLHLQNHIKPPGLYLQKSQWVK